MSLKVTGVKIREQKQLCSLKELHSHFKNSHPGVKVGLLNFASLYSRNCIMAGDVCACVYEE
jgi:hypothetical protein